MNTVNTIHATNDSTFSGREYERIGATCHDDHARHLWRALKRQRRGFIGLARVTQNLRQAPHPALRTEYAPCRRLGCRETTCEPTCKSGNHWVRRQMAWDWPDLVDCECGALGIPCVATDGRIVCRECYAGGA